MDNPTPLRPNGTNLLPFPENALPPILREMASAIATTTSTDDSKKNVIADEIAKLQTEISNIANTAYR